jgi:hypothetical protein
VFRKRTDSVQDLSFTLYFSIIHKMITVVSRITIISLLAFSSYYYSNFAVINLKLMDSVTQIKGYIKEAMTKTNE